MPMEGSFTAVPYGPQPWPDSSSFGRGGQRGPPPVTRMVSPPVAVGPPYGGPAWRPVGGTWVGPGGPGAWGPGDESFEESSLGNLELPYFGNEQEEHVPGPVPTHFRFNSASTSRQHPIKTEMGAIEADVVEEAPCFLGVCDGVSEVQRLGIPPDEFPRELLQRTREGFEERDARIVNEMNHRSWPSAVPRDGSWLVDIIQDSYKIAETQGSTTMLLAVIEETNRLLVANLGDCCLLNLRRIPTQPQRLQIVYKTEARRFDHNKPFQIAKLDNVDEPQMANLIRSTRVDAVPTQHGDILVMGTDGVFDNLHDEDVVRIVERTCPWTPPAPGYNRIPQQPMWGAFQSLPSAPAVAQLECAADAIVGEALNSVCKAEVDEKTGQMKWPPGARQTPSGLGGKADDTTVIVGTVVQVTDPVAHEDFFYKVHASNKQGWFDNACCGGAGNSSSKSDGCTLS